MDVERLLPRNPVRPIWSGQSALVYIGGLVTLFATVALIGIADADGGDWAAVAASLAAAVAAIAIAEALDRADRAIAAGVAATLAVGFAGILVGTLLQAIGVLDDDGYQPATHVVEAVLVVGSLLAIRRYRAPLPVLVLALTVWFTLVDVVSAVSDTGSAEEIASLVAGAFLAAAGFVVDRARRQAFGFWLHAVGGAAAGGALVSLIGDGGWILIALLSLGYVALTFVLDRSSYAVLGAVGAVIATTMFAVDPLSFVSAFIPFAPPGEGDSLEGWQIAASYLVCGLVLGAIGVAGRVWRLPRSGPVAADE